MAITKPSMAVNIISTLATTSADRGLTDDQFKAKFDETPAAIKTYLSTVLTTEVDTALANYTRSPGYAVDTGAANAYVVTLNPVPTAYVDGMVINVKMANPNTGNSTINVNGLGVKSVYKANYTNLFGNDLLANNTYSLIYSAGRGFMITGGDTNAVKLGGVAASGYATLAAPTFTGIVTTAGQVAFPATQNPSANVNTLDDYEEGAFTPVIYGTTSAGTGTYVRQLGKYTKIGNAVHFSIYITWSAHDGTGSIQISGLPFAPSIPSALSLWPSLLSLTAGNIACAYADTNSTIVINQVPTGGGATGVVPIDTSASLMLSGTYPT